MSDKSVNDENFIPKELVETAERATNCSLPEKSKAMYFKTYEEFVMWQTAKNTKSFNQTVLLAYFFEMATTLNSATLWSRFSMLKSIITVKHNIDIGQYAKLRNFLKNNHKNYKPKKAMVFTVEEIDKFLNEAPNDTYLPTKVNIYKLVPTYFIQL